MSNSQQLEALFTLMTSLGNNHVDGVVNLLRDAGLLHSREMESYVRALLPDRHSIGYDQFHAAIKKYGAKYNISMGEITYKLMLKAPPVLRDFGSDPKFPVTRQSTNSTQAEIEVSSEVFRASTARRNSNRNGAIHED